MSNNEAMRRAFEDMLENIDIRMFLKASPHESGERSKLDKKLSDEMFYDFLYANSTGAENLISEIKDKIVKEDTHNFVLSGYKGCGKSTFVGYLLRKINTRNLIIKFDDHWEPSEGIYQNIVMFLYGKIYNDILPQNDNEVCTISDKYIEIFYNNLNGEYIERNVDLHNYFSFFVDKLIYAVRLRKKTDYNIKDVKIALIDHIKAHIKSGSISNLMMLLVFWDFADKIVHNENKKSCIVFENLDVIHNTSDVHNLVENVVAFRNNIDKITESIFYQGKPICDPTQDYILIFVMRETTKAEFSSCINHFSDKKIRFHHFMTLSEIYDVYDIISKRYNYLEKISNKFASTSNFYDLKRKIKNITLILSDVTIRKKIFAFFNNDYRTCIEALEKFCFSDTKILSAINNLINTHNEDNWTVFGYRSIIYRHIFNVFVKGVFFERVRKYEYSISENGKVGSINLDRMILLYLNNSQKSLFTNELEEKEYVPLNILYVEILKFCSKSETVVEAIWNMYDLQNTEMWNHLVTFDDIFPISIEELRREMDAVIQKKDDGHFAKIKITLAGQVYLNQILPHFEYYASRSEKGKGYSLFCLTAEELCKIHRVEKTIKNERKEVSQCCCRLFEFFKDVFDKIDEFKGKNFLDTEFASIKASSTKETVSRMYHCEKIIYSNIGYLDSFRFFVFYIMDEVQENGGFNCDVDIKEFFNKIVECNKEYKDRLPAELTDYENDYIILKKGGENLELHRKSGDIVHISLPLEIVIKIIKICYNKSIIDSIVNFMKLYGLHGGKQSTVYSSGTEKICQAFDSCIDYIRNTSKYEDFLMAITYVNGERIQSAKNKKNRQEKLEQRRLASIERRTLLNLNN